MRLANHVYRSWIEEQNVARPDCGPGMFFEAIIEDIYRALVNPGDLVVDCGANRGLHTWPLSDLVGPGGEVLAIEAIPALAAALEEARRAGGRANVRIAATAIGAAPGRASFTWVRGGDGYSGLREREMPEEFRSDIAVIDVPVTTLERLLAGRDKPVRFMKLDLEGGEFDALRGGAEILNTDRPCVIFENGRQSTADLYSYRLEDWFGLFSRIGYRTYDLFGRRFTQDQWNEPDWPWYFIAVPADSPEEAYVRERLHERIAMIQMRSEMRSLAEARVAALSAEQAATARLAALEARIAPPDALPAPRRSKLESYADGLRAIGYILLPYNRRRKDKRRKLLAGIRR